MDDLLAKITDRMPASAEITVHGSATNPSAIDGWSDLDLRLWLPVDVDLPAALGDLQVWAFEEAVDDGTQTLRMVLADGRRLDLSVALSVSSGRFLGLRPAVDNEIRFLAAIAVTKLGRGDHLIGYHLTLEILRHCLVESMRLRDLETCSTVHRTGTARDADADRVRRIAAGPLPVAPRPNIVEQACLLYGELRAAREPGYRPDWTGLSAVITRGLGS